MEGIKFCTLYGKNKHNLNVTSILRYVCYNNQICCDHRNGCCPGRKMKYYESWTFWAIVFGIILACYLLCWYCKKLEKKRQSARENPANPQRPIDTNSVDNLLQTLISVYRNRLPNQIESTQNLDANKALDTTRDRPPEYVVALTMPKPLENTEIFNSSPIIPSMGIVHSWTVIETEDDLTIPSYEEAVKEIV